MQWGLEFWYKYSKNSLKKIIFIQPACFYGFDIIQYHIPFLLNETALFQPLNSALKYETKIKKEPILNLGSYNLYLTVAVSEI